MEINLVTHDDLDKLKTDLINEFKTLLGQSKPQGEWLKSKDVKQLLKISDSTLQTLRINGTLPYSEMGGSKYYSYEDVMKVLEKNKRNKFKVKEQIG